MNRACTLLLGLLIAPSALAQPAAEPDLSAGWREARDLDAHTEYERAADTYERYAEACLASSTALLQEGAPCASAGEALQRAMVLRRALGQRERAERDAEAYVGHFLYAEPRAAIRVRYEVARMFLDAGELTHATEATERLEATHADTPTGLGLVANALRARIADERADGRRAARYWRRVERSWEHERAALREGGAIPLAWIRGAVAEGRLQRAQRSVRRYLAIRGPSSRRIDEPNRWWREVMTPWLVRSRRRLVLARTQLERIYELASPRHSVIAAALIGVMYEHQSALHASLDLPDDDFVRAVVHDGEANPGYDQATAHLETCVRWAAHHGVAREWAERCEEHLHDLDPTRYPRQAELFREQPFLPTMPVPLEAPQ